MYVLNTPRLALRHAVPEDGEFLLELLTDPDFIRYIGDRGVRTLDDTPAYVANGPQASYREHGYGLYVVELRESGAPIGLCGLVKRDYLQHADLGFAFLRAFRGQGYALEAARATLSHARDDFGMTRLAAVTSLDNEASMSLLRNLGFELTGLVQAKTDTAPLNLFEVEL
jgi:RimJ/RimL family protein N-acetyltransferase